MSAILPQRPEGALMTAPTVVRTWHVHVTYNNGSEGSLDVDYLVDDVSEVGTLITQSFGIKAIEQIMVHRLDKESIVPLNAIYGRQHE